MEPPAEARNELVDVVDEEGNTIAAVTRQEVRARRLPHRCVYLLIFNRAGDLFVHLRTPTKDVYPAHWDVTVGGVLAAGESFDEGAAREAQEELGVQAAPQALFPFRYSDPASIVHAMVYRAALDGPFRLQPEEIVRGQFVPLRELPERTQRDPFCPDGLAVLEEYRRRFC
jgi:isopentenyldiphosphate isomerase